jgi:hypothetical protein
MCLILLKLRTLIFRKWRMLCDHGICVKVLCKETMHIDIFVWNMEILMETKRSYIGYFIGDINNLSRDMEILSCRFY